MMTMNDEESHRERLAVLEMRLSGHESLCEHRQGALRERLEETIRELRREVGDLRAGLRRIELTMYGGVVALLGYLAQRFLLERLGGL